MPQTMVKLTDGNVISKIVAKTIVATLRVLEEEDPNALRELYTRLRNDTYEMPTETARLLRAVKIFQAYELFYTTTYKVTRVALQEVKGRVVVVDPWVEKPNP